MRYLFLAYRPWALKIINKLKKNLLVKILILLVVKIFFIKI